MRFTVLGFYDKENIGDEAYKLAFPLLFPEHEFTFTDKISQLDKDVILGGGNVITPYFLNQLANHQNKKFAMSVDLLTNEYFDFAASRNKVSETNKIISLPDFTFILKSNKDRGKYLIKELFQKNGCDLYEKLVIIVINSYLNVGHAKLARDQITFDKMCMDLAHIMDNTEASFMLLPFGNGFPYNDRISNSTLYAKCKWHKKNLVVYEKLSVQQTLDICAAANVVISSRLHGNIFACIGGTPFIDLNHHDKTTSFLEFIEQTYWAVNYWRFENHKLTALLREFLLNNDYYRQKTAKIGETMRKTLYDAKTQLNNIISQYDQD